MQGTLNCCQVHASVTSCRQRPCCSTLARLATALTSCPMPAGRSDCHRLRATYAPKPYFQPQPKRTSSPRQVHCSSGSEQGPPKSTEFGYSRKDVILIGASIFGGGFAMYYGLQAAGLSAGIAGNFVQLFVVLGLCIGWVGSYIFRVANKDMTYVKQLENYEEEVTAKRLGEMPESEREKLMASVEAEKERRQARQQQQSK